jgi:CRP-like cAMP-binding protein
MFQTIAGSVVESRSLSPFPVNKLLATLPTDDFQCLLPHLAVVPFRVKDVLYKQDAKIEHVFFPGGGACSLMKVMRDGKIAEIATIGNEGVIGASVFFGDDRSFSETIVQVAQGEGFRMSAENFVSEMSRRGAFYNRVIRYSQALMSQVMQTTVCNGLHSVEQRCCRWLLMTDDRVESDNMRVTHELLSTMLGVRRPTVTLIMGDLQKLGLVENRRGKIHIADRSGLEASACECYATVKATFARLFPEITAGKLAS